MRAGTKIATSMGVLLAASWPAGAQSASPAVANACANYASEAANRSGLPLDIVLRVMMAESGGNSRIVSSKGAMGCMQIMPGTWSYLTGRYRLGSDPFHARMNMIGGAMYLAELGSRYGWPGAFSAYNAGPGRYQRYVQSGAALPAETVAYTGRLGANVDPPPTVVIAPRWQAASLFLARRPREEASEQPAQIASSAAAKIRPANPLFPLSEGPERDENTGVAR